MALFEFLRNNIQLGWDALRGGRPIAFPVNEYRTLPMPLEPGYPSPIGPVIGHPVPVMPEPPVAIPDSPWVSSWLNHDDFSATGLPWRANEWFSLAQLRTPEDRQVVVRAGERRIRMYFKGQLTVAGQNLATAAARTVTLPHLVQTLQAAVTLPTTFHPEIEVWGFSAGSWIRLTITAVDYAAGTVTFTEPAGLATGTPHTIEIYYTHRNGEFRFRVLRELGGIDDSAATAYNGTFSAIHTLDQTNRDSMVAWPSEVQLVPGMRLSLEVFTPSVPMVWTARSRHYIAIYAESRHIRVRDRATLSKRAELAARNNL